MKDIKRKGIISFDFPTNFKNILDININFENSVVNEIFDFSISCKRVKENI